MRTPRLAILATLCAGGCLALTACGGGSSATDSHGFTSSDRSAAQAALNSLLPTSVSTAVIQITATSGLPAKCKVRLQSSKPPKFTLWVDWTPKLIAGQGVARALTWVRADIGLEGLYADTLKLGNVQQQTGRAAASAKLLTLAGAAGALTNPVEDCVLLANGDLKLVPAPQN